MAMIVNLGNNTNFLERTETLVKYYDEVKKYDDTVNHETEKKLFKIIKSEDSTEAEKKWAKDLLINANQRFVISVVRQYANNNNAMDLINEGNIGLIEAIDKFDINKDVHFITLAVYYIKRAINLYRVNNSNVIKKSNISKTYHIISKSRNAFLQMHHRQPSPEELMEYVNEKYGLDIKNSLDMVDVQITRIDNEFENSDDLYNIDEVNFNKVSASENNYEEKVSADFNKKMVSSLLETLTPREQKIIKMSFGIDTMFERCYEVKEIADEMGLTTERIRQIKASAIGRMKKEYSKKINETF